MLYGIFAQFGPGADRPEDMIERGAAESMTETDFIAKEITRWLASPVRKLQIKGDRCYKYEFELEKKRSFLRDADGAPAPSFRPDKPPVTDNLYAKMVDQKAGYVLGKPFSIKSGSEAYDKVLSYVFDKNFKKVLDRVAVGTLTGGVAWIHPYYNENGELLFKMFPAHEILPFWKDSEHTELDLAIRYYTSLHYEGRDEKTVEHVEVYSESGVKRYTRENGSLTEDVETPGTAYAADAKGNALGWGRIPLVAFRANPYEIPLIKRVETLQEAINAARAEWTASMNEGIDETIIVLKNYDGENISDFRKNLLQ